MSALLPPCPCRLRSVSRSRWRQPHERVSPFFSRVAGSTTTVDDAPGRWRSDACPRACYRPTSSYSADRQDVIAIVAERSRRPPGLPDETERQQVAAPHQMRPCSRRRRQVRNRWRSGSPRPAPRGSWPSSCASISRAATRAAPSTRKHKVSLALRFRAKHKSAEHREPN
jgi:hypothetical protein